MCQVSCEIIPVNVDEFLVDIFYHFHNSLKCRESLKEYADFCDFEFKSIEALDHEMAIFNS